MVIAGVSDVAQLRTLVELVRAIYPRAIVGNYLFEIYPALPKGMRTSVSRALELILSRAPALAPITEAVRIFYPVAVLLKSGPGLEFHYDTVFERPCVVLLLPYEEGKCNPSLSFALQGIPKTPYIAAWFSSPKFDLENLVSNYIYLINPQVEALLLNPPQIILSVPPEEIARIMKRYEKDVELLQMLAEEYFKMMQTHSST